MPRLAPALAFAAVAAIASPASAQTLACQYTAAAGFNWDGNEWRPARLVPSKPFFLKIEGRGLSRSSVASAVHSNTPNLAPATCDVIGGGPPFVVCMTDGGASLTFNPATMQGAISKGYGAAQPATDPDRDTLSIAPFVCQRM